MKKVAVSCDSVSIVPAKAQEDGLPMASFTVVVNGKPYHDADINMDELYEALEDKDNLPTTSMPNVDDFEKLFTEQAKNAEGVLHLTITAPFSKSYENAMRARETVTKAIPDVRFEVVDSRSAGIGVFLVAREAVLLAEKGMGIDELLKETDRIIYQIRSLSARDTLFYLDKGGRIFEAKSWSDAEGKAGFRSIIEIDGSVGGSVRPIARAKTRADIINKLVELTKQNLGGSSKTTGAIGYSRGAEEQVEKLRQALMAELDFERFDIAESSAVVVTHNGKGFIDYAFMAV